MTLSAPGTQTSPDQLPAETQPPPCCQAVVHEAQCGVKDWLTGTLSPHMVHLSGSEVVSVPPPPPSPGWSPHHTPFHDPRGEPHIGAEVWLWGKGSLACTGGQSPVPQSKTTKTSESSSEDQVVVWLSPELLMCWKLPVFLFTVFLSSKSFFTSVFYKGFLHSLLS